MKKEKKRKKREKEKDELSIVCTQRSQYWSTRRNVYLARASFLKLVWVDNSSSMLIERLSIVATVGLSPPPSPFLPTDIPVDSSISTTSDGIGKGQIKKTMNFSFPLK